MCICQTGVVVEILCGEVGRTGASAPTNLLVLEMPRLPYVKYSTGANETTHTAYRALGKPDWTAARSAFLAERTISEWHAEAKCFFRRVSAIPRPQRLFSPHSFLARQKRMGPRSGGDGAPNSTAPSAHPKYAAGGIPHRLVQKRMGRRTPPLENNRKEQIPWKKSDHTRYPASWSCCPGRRPSWKP